MPLIPIPNPTKKKHKPKTPAHLLPLSYFYIHTTYHNPIKIKKKTIKNNLIINYLKLLINNIHIKIIKIFIKKKKIILKIK